MREEECLEIAGIESHAHQVARGARPGVEQELAPACDHQCARTAPLGVLQRRSGAAEPDVQAIAEVRQRVAGQPALCHALHELHAQLRAPGVGEHGHQGDDPQDGKSQSSSSHVVRAPCVRRSRLPRFVVAGARRRQILGCRAGRSRAAREVFSFTSIREE